MSYKKIRLKNSNKTVLVDYKDYHLCARITWRLNRKGYAKSGCGIGLMHRFIMNYKLKYNQELTVHHRNGDKLDNRRCNLHVLTEYEHIELHRIERLHKETVFQLTDEA